MERRDGAAIQMALKRIHWSQRAYFLIADRINNLTFKMRVTPITLEAWNVQVKLTSKSKENTSISASSK